MRKIYFITGNVNKYQEIKSIIPELEQRDIDSSEIQSLNLQEIIENKLKSLCRKQIGRYIVEDTSLKLEALKGLPGPLIKWFMNTIGYEGIYEICNFYKNYNATAEVIIGYTDGKLIKNFSGFQKGQIVKPRGKLGWGWDPIFKPEGFDITYGEMKSQQKFAISMRKIAADKLKQYLIDEKT